jgi:acyl carrier protein
MGLDSIDLLMRIEKEFGIEFKTAEAEKMVTVGMMHDAVWDRIRNTGEYKKEKMIKLVNQVISDQIGVDLEEITPEKYFVKDLGIDR